MTPRNDTAPLPRLALHPAARVVVGGEAVMPIVAQGFTAIAARPVAEAAARVAGCMQQGAGFVVAAHPEKLSVLADQDGFLHTLTSGSTGAPKQIRRTHLSWISSFQQNAIDWCITDKDRYAVLGGLENSLPLYALTEGLFLGATVEVLAGMRADRQAMALEGATILYATPTQVRAFAGAGTVASVRVLAIGGGALDAATMAIARTIFPNAAIRQFYGAAETSFIAMADDATPQGSVGKAYPGVQIDIRGGLVWVQSPYCFDGYAAGSSGSTRVENGWVTVGEVGHLDAEGSLFILGRADRMFTVADRNFHPEPVEAFLMAQDGVQHAAILPAQDDQRGAVPVGYYAGTANMQTLLTATRQKFGAAFAPRKLTRLDDWPLLAGGKTDLKALSS